MKIGGVKEKCMAARRAGATTLIFPAGPIENAVDSHSKQLSVCDTSVVGDA